MHTTCTHCSADIRHNSKAITLRIGVNGCRLSLREPLIAVALTKIGIHLRELSRPYNRFNLDRDLRRLFHLQPQLCGLGGDIFRTPLFFPKLDTALALDTEFDSEGILRHRHRCFIFRRLEVIFTLLIVGRGQNHTVGAVGLESVQLAHRLRLVLVFGRLVDQLTVLVRVSVRREVPGFARGEQISCLNLRVVQGAWIAYLPPPLSTFLLDGLAVPVLLESLCFHLNLLRRCVRLLATLRIILLLLVLAGDFTSNYTWSITLHKVSRLWPGQWLDFPLVADKWFGGVCSEKYHFVIQILMIYIRSSGLCEFALH